MEFYVYIVQSGSRGRYYCGSTSDVDRRVRQHNDPDYRLSRTTKVFEGPWRVVWFTGLETRGEAMKLEKKIKKRGIARFLAELRRQSPAGGGINH
jgi:putative endonuclease